MAEGGIPAEALISLRRRLDAMPARSADRKGLIAGAAALYGVSRATLYRALKQHPRPQALRRSDRGQPRKIPLSDLERYCEIIAALKIRTTNKKGRHLSTVRAIELMETYGIETPDGLVQPPAGLLRRSTVNRYLQQWCYDHTRMTREPPAVRFQARRSNELWQFDLSPSDLKQVKHPLWAEAGRGHPTLMLYSAIARWLTLMIEMEPSVTHSSPVARWVDNASGAVQAAVPALLFGLRLWASVCLALYVAFWLELDTPSWAGTTAAIVCQPHLGASLRKGWYRLVGTVVGAIAIVVITGCFPQNRTAFLFVLALWGACCALLATLLRNFASYSAALAGYTAAIIASDQLGAVSGLNGQAFMLAVNRASEICIGIVCAGIVLAGTDFGGARRRVESLLTQLSAEIACRFTGTLADAGAEFEQTQTIRRELVRRVVALDPVIDEALGESSELRYHSPVLQNALDGLVRALANWRTVAVVLTRLPRERAQQEAGAVVAEMPEQLHARLAEDEAARWLAGPTRLLQACEAAVQRLYALPAQTPSLRLLADQASEALAGLSQALIALALLVADPTRPVSRIRGRRRLRIPDWLPPLVNAARALVVIVAAELFWIVTAWPGGANAITFAAIIVILFAARAEQAYAIAIGFMIGSILTVVIVATLLFALLPNVETFASFALIIGFVLVPVGTVFALQWQPAIFTGMVTVFVPLLAPTNPMTYDPQQYYNAALTIITGAGAGALSYRLLPPLSPAYRTRRLLALTLRDLCRLATGPLPDMPQDWEQRMFARFALLPDQAQPLQRSWLTAAFSAGTNIIQLRHLCPRFGLNRDLGVALEAVARGNSVEATAKLAEIDAALTSRPGEAALRARGLILAISEALTQHAAYFGAGAPA